jgi:gluconolactonase
MTGRTFIIVFAVTVLVVRTAGQEYARPLNRVVNQNVQVEHCFGGGEFTEGPAVAPDGTVYFCDLTFEGTGEGRRGHLWAYDPGTGKCIRYRSPSNMANGLEFDSAGHLIIAEGGDSTGGRLTSLDPKTLQITVLTTGFRGARFNSPNDLVSARDGTVYFSDPLYDGRQHRQQPVMGVYRRSPAGEVTLCTGDVPMPNGIALSPDGNTLYVGCYDEGSSDVQPARPRSMAVYAFGIGMDGSLGKRHTLITFGDDAGPDGIAVDAQGNIFVAVRNDEHPGIGLYTPTGEEAGFVELPEVPSNLTFDRSPTAQRVYVTAGTGLYRVTWTRDCPCKPAGSGEKH